MAAVWWFARKLTRVKESQGLKAAHYGHHTRHVSTERRNAFESNGCSDTFVIPHSASNNHFFALYPSHKSTTLKISKKSFNTTEARVASTSAFPVLIFDTKISQDL
jgi:hypothetical protein